MIHKEFLRLCSQTYTSSVTVVTASPQGEACEKENTLQKSLQKVLDISKILVYNNRVVCTFSSVGRATDS